MLAAVVAAAALALGLTSSIAGGGGAPANDNFSNAQVVTGSFGTVSNASIAGATAEVANAAAAIDPSQYDVNATLNHQYSGVAANNPATDPTNEPNHGDPAGPHNSFGVPLDGSSNPTVEYPPTGTQGTSMNPNPANQSIWFTWTAPFTAATTMDTIGSDLDTVMSVYTLHGLSTPPATPQAQDLNLVAGNDDCNFLNNVGSFGASCVRFMAQAGTQYWIAVDSSAPWNGPAGTDVTFNWAESAQNAAISTATTVAPNATSISGSNVGGGNGIIIGGQTGANAVYYAWTPPAGTIQLGTSSTCATTFNMLLGAFTAASDGSLGSQVASASIGSGPVNSLAFVADGTTKYFIVVEGQSSNDAGQFCLNALETAGATLGLTKVVSPTSAHPGDLLTYTIGVSNASSDTPALGVNVSDTLPSGTTFQNATGAPGGCTLVSGAVNCSAGTIQAGGSVSITINLSLAPTVPVGAVTNTAAVSAINASPSSASATTNVLPAADVTLTKTAMPDSIFVGDNLGYQLVVTNQGPMAADAVVLTDAFPAGSTFVSVSDPSCTYNTTSLNCSIGTMAVGATKTFTLTLKPPAGATSVTNTAFAGSPVTFDPMQRNNTSSATTTIVPSADVAIAKTGPASVLGGGVVGYSIGVTNSGPSAAANVQVTDQLPADAISPTADSACTISSGMLVTCLLGTLPVGATVNLGIAYTLQASTTITNLSNTATVTSDTRDPNSANNSATATTTVTPLADLSIQNTGTTTVSPGGDLTYSLVVTNTGPGAANAVISDPLPAGMTFTSVVGATCSASATIVQCAPIALASGASATVTLTETLSDSSNLTGIVNVASVAAANLNDPNLSNNSSSASATVNQVGCPVGGDVHGNQTWTMLVGLKKVNVHVEVDGDCDFDKKTGKIFLHHAHVKVQIDGMSALNFDAKQDPKHNDVKNVTILGPNDATITGSWNGTAFTVTLHDGGSGNNKNDMVRVVYGSFDSSTLSTKHGEVKIDQDH